MIGGYIAIHSSDLEVQSLISMPCTSSSTHITVVIMRASVQCAYVCLLSSYTLIGSALSLRILHNSASLLLFSLGLVRCCVYQQHVQETQCASGRIGIFPCQVYFAESHYYHQSIFGIGFILHKSTLINWLHVSTDSYCSLSFGDQYHFRTPNVWLVPQQEIQLLTLPCAIKFVVLAFWLREYFLVVEHWASSVFL